MCLKTSDLKKNKKAGLHIESVFESSGTSAKKAKAEPKKIRSFLPKSERMASLVMTLLFRSLSNSCPLNRVQTAVAF